MDYVEPEEHDGAWQTDEGSMLAEETSNKLPGRVQKGTGAASSFEHNTKRTTLEASTLEYV